MDWKKLGKKFYYGIFLEDEKYVDEIIIIIIFLVGRGSTQ